VGSTIDVEAVAAILGGEDVLKDEVHDLGDLERVVARGLPAEALRRTVRSAIGEGAGEPARRRRALADRLVPPATRKRRAGAALTPEESARVERLARVVALAEHVWEDRAKAQAFLARPHALLEDRAPLDVAQTELGARRVERLLLKLEYGLPV
jgi:putative toxin-antitoxin system antitoxin component (TIGR02293 family)